MVSLETFGSIDKSTGFFRRAGSYPTPPRKKFLIFYFLLKATTNTLILHIEHKTFHRIFNDTMSLKTGPFAIFMRREGGKIFLRRETSEKIF
jgi:hypothetical protein